MFLESLSNFLQGHGWQDNGSRSRQDEEERKRREREAKNTPAVKPQTTMIRPGGVQLPSELQLPMKPTSSKFSQRQIDEVKKNPNAPWSPELQKAAGAAPGTQQMLDTIKKKTVPAQQADPGDLTPEQKKYYEVSSYIPIWSLANRLGAWGAEGLGNLTGNKEMAARASNARSVLDVGMTNKEIDNDFVESEINKELNKTGGTISQAQRDKIKADSTGKLRALQTGVEAASPLDLVGATSLAKTPVIAAAKSGITDIIKAGIRKSAEEAAKEAVQNGATKEVAEQIFSQTTKDLLAEAVKTQSKSAAVGTVAGGAVGAGVSAFMNDGEIDPNSVLGGMGTGLFYGAAIPGFGKPGVGPATKTALQDVEASIKRPLSQAEQAEVLQGGAPKTVVDEAAAIGNGISTPSTRASAEQSITTVSKVAEAEANPALVNPNVVPEPELPQPVRPSLQQMMSDMMSVDGYQPGFARIPGKAPEPAPLNAADVPLKKAPEEPTMEDLAAIEAKGLDKVDTIAAPENPEVGFLREDIKSLAELARKRELAGASEKSLEPIYAQIDTKTAELEGMMKPSKPTRAQEQAVVQNERVAKAQAELEKAVGLPKKVEKKAPVVEEVPTKPLTKKEEIKEAKTQAINKEEAKQAVKEQVQVLKKVNKAVAKATGKGDDNVKSAPKVAKYVARMFANDADLSRTIESLGAKRGSANYAEAVGKAVKTVSKMSDDEVLASANKVDFGLGDARGYEKVAHGAEGLISRLGRMRKAAEAAGDTDKAKKYVTAVDNVMKQLTETVGEGATSTSVMGYIYRNASPDLMHARTKQNFEKVGGAMNDAEDSAFRKTYEDVYTAQKEVDTLNDKHTELMEKFQSGKKLTDKEISDLKAGRKNAEKVLEAALAENERVSGEIYARNVKEGAIKDEGVGRFGPAYEGWRKSFMLSAPSGRLRDLGSTTLAVGDKVAVDTIEAVIGKIFKDKNLRQSAALDGKSILAGMKEGIENIRQIASGDKKGGIYVDSGPEGLARKLKTAKTQLSPTPQKANKFVRTVNAASAAPTELFRGYRTNRLRQYADAAGRAQGFAGDKLKQFKDLYEINPPKAIDDAVEQDFLLPSSMHKNFVYNAVDKLDSFLRNQAASIKNPKGRKAADLAVREFGLLSMPFKKYAAGSMHRLLTDQNILFNVGSLGKNLITKNKQGAITDVSRLTVNSAKLGLATALVLPFMSETDGNNQSYSPPYLKLGDNYVPLQSFGPVIAAPLGAAWANKKFMDKLNETGNLAEAAGDWAGSYYKTIMQSTGADSIVAGDSPIMRLASGATGYQDEDGSDTIARQGGRFVQDILSQWVPAGFRDINSVLDTMIEFGGGNQYAPNTKVEDADGKKDYLGSGLKTVAGAIPGVRQLMASADPSEKANADPITRLLGASKASDIMKQEKADGESLKDVKENKLTTSTARVAKIAGNEKLKGVLDDETKILYDKLGTKQKLTQEDYDKIESGIKKGEQKLLQSDDYDNYLAAINSRREKLAGDPSTAKKDFANIDFDINVATTLKKAEVPYEVYNLYAGSSKSGDDAGVKAGISNGELEQMMDPESPYYNMDAAQKLIAVDKLMTEAGLSDNSLNAKQMKYLKAIGGAGGGGKAKVITDIGSISKKTLNGTGPSLQYRDLDSYNSPIPNLSKQTAATNFKKNITVKRGVAL